MPEISTLLSFPRSHKVKTILDQSNTNAIINCMQAACMKTDRERGNDGKPESLLPLRLASTPVCACVDKHLTMPSKVAKKEFDRGTPPMTFEVHKKEITSHVPRPPDMESEWVVLDLRSWNSESADPRDGMFVMVCSLTTLGNKQ